MGAVGSSPLARGTQGADDLQAFACRFIPARAGNTRRSPCAAWSPPVHPRSRGEHQGRPTHHSHVSGSSPLARGTRVLEAQRACEARFIPARAGNTVRTGRYRRPATVHPRSRGEHIIPACADCINCGSSPLARGTRDMPARLAAAEGFIPARAGNTKDVVMTVMVMSVHPRSRGEHRPRAPGLQHLAGSSPLARGTRPRPRRRRARRRFIPARAGNTLVTSAEYIRSPVHPRSRGEHAVSIALSIFANGSSPLARGTPRRVDADRKRPRFIPARAGNTKPSSSVMVISTVHPRSRGEHMPIADMLRNVTGSSPLARGTRSAIRLWCMAHRFIPARAGNTIARCIGRQSHAGSSPLARGTLGWSSLEPRGDRFIPARAGNTRRLRTAGRASSVHPRSRGEHRPPARGGGCLNGSSPLARGTHRRRLSARARLRFIPARAGNTARPRPAAGPRSVHPRSRGEHHSLDPGGGAADGSSPLARGTHLLAFPQRVRVRFIPARAGNTRTAASPHGAATVHPRSRGEHVERTCLNNRYAGSSPLARGTRS